MIYWARTILVQLNMDLDLEAYACVSPVWVAPLSGSLPCCVGRPSVRVGPLRVGPLWVPPPPVFLVST